MDHTASPDSNPSPDLYRPDAPADPVTVADVLVALTVAVVGALFMMLVQREIRG